MTDVLIPEQPHGAITGQILAGQMLCGQVLSGDIYTDFPAELSGGTVTLTLDTYLVSDDQPLELSADAAIVSVPVDATVIVGDSNPLLLIVAYPDLTVQYHLIVTVDASGELDLGADPADVLWARTVDLTTTDFPLDLDADAVTLTLDNAIQLPDSNPLELLADAPKLFVNLVLAPIVCTDLDLEALDCTPLALAPVACTALDLEPLVPLEA